MPAGMAWEPSCFQCFTQTSFPGCSPDLPAFNPTQGEMAHSFLKLVGLSVTPWLPGPGRTQNDFPPEKRQCPLGSLTLAPAQAVFSLTEEIQGDWARAPHRPTPGPELPLPVCRSHRQPVTQGGTFEPACPSNAHCPPNPGSCNHLPLAALLEPHCSCGGRHTGGHEPMPTLPPPCQVISTLRKQGKKIICSKMLRRE